ncbi:hypothetical protein E4U53_000570 [Claviceps sorghi]|nr:hypothetical protein E4U53_000570 [Claviceps sorghi]
MTSAATYDGTEPEFPGGSPTERAASGNGFLYIFLVRLADILLPGENSGQDLVMVAPGHVHRARAWILESTCAGTAAVTDVPLPATPFRHPMCSGCATAQWQFSRGRRAPLARSGSAKDRADMKSPDQQRRALQHPADVHIASFCMAGNLFAIAQTRVVRRAGLLDSLATAVPRGDTGRDSTSHGQRTWRRQKRPVSLLRPLRLDRRDMCLYDEFLPSGDATAMPRCLCVRCFSTLAPHVGQQQGAPFSNLDGHQPLLHPLFLSARNYVDSKASELDAVKVARRFPTAFIFRASLAALPCVMTVSSSRLYEVLLSSISVVALLVILLALASPPSASSRLP